MADAPPKITTASVMSEGHMVESEMSTAACSDSWSESPQSCDDSSPPHGRCPLSQHAAAVRRAAATRSGGRSRDVEEFTVTVVKRTPGEPLGLETLASKSMPRILISNVGDGPVAEWNEQHPEQAVKAKDWIIAVNGQRGTSWNMYTTIEENDRVELRIWRSGTDRAETTSSA